MFIYFTMIQVYELSLLYAPQRNKKWFINLFWECCSQCKNCSSNKNFFSKIEKAIDFWYDNMLTIWRNKWVPICQVLETVFST